jgi:hypothetical protein
MPREAATIAFRANMEMVLIKPAEPVLLVVCEPLVDADEWRKSTWEHR